MEGIENNLERINEKIGELFFKANFWKFSYSSVYTLEFYLNQELYGYNFFSIDVATRISIYKGNEPYQRSKHSVLDIFVRMLSPVSFAP